MDEEWYNRASSRSWAVALPHGVRLESQAGRSAALKLSASEFLGEAANMRARGGPGHYTLLFMALELALKSFIVRSDNRFFNMNEDQTDAALRTFSHNISKLYRECCALGMRGFTDGANYSEWIDRYYLSTDLRYKYAHGGSVPLERDVESFAQHVLTC